VQIPIHEQTLAINWTNFQFFRPMINPPEDEGLHVVRRDEPEPKLLNTAVSRVQPEPLEAATATRSRVAAISVLAFVGAFVLAVLIIVVAYTYVTERKPARRLATMVSDPAEAALPSVAASIAPAVEKAATETLLPITADMLHVTSIALGKVPLTVVNGQRLGAGDSLTLKTPQGVAILELVSIEDGVVRFKYGSQMVEAKLSLAIPPKNLRDRIAAPRS